MGYVKIKKASGYDLVCAENVKSVKLIAAEDAAHIEVKYIGDATALQIVGSTSMVQADVDKIIAAIDQINGGGGPGIFPEDLSQLATSVG